MESAHQDFEDLCKCLNAHGVEYVIVGGHAFARYALPRFTGDFDVYVGPAHDNVQRLFDAIAEFWAPIEGTTVADVALGTKVLQMGVKPWQIHVMTEISGVTWAEAWAGRVAEPYGETPAFFIGRTEFLKNKRASGRPRDLADIAEVEATERAEDSE